MNPQKKKIAIVSDAVYPFNKGGKEKRIYDISTRLAAAGYEVTIYCMQWWTGEKVIVKDNVTLHAISPYYPLYHKGRRSIKEAIFFAIHCIKLINKEFDVIEIDHMPHLVLFPMKIVCLLRGKKMIVTWHEVWGLEYWKHYLGTMGIVAYYIERLSARLPDLIVSVSEHTTRNLHAILGVEKPIVTVPNGLDVSHIMNHIPAKEGADIVFAGRLLSHKNVDVLLQAMVLLTTKHPDLKLWVIGDGPERASLEGLAQKLGISKNVTFLGFLNDQSELYRIMHASRMFVLPSSREGFGIAALEANACGIPVITIDHEQNATKDLIENGTNGIVTTLHDSAIATAIESLLENPKERAVYHAHAQRYDLSRTALEMQKIYAL